MLALITKLKIGIFKNIRDIFGSSLDAMLKNLFWDLKKLLPKVKEEGKAI